MEFRCATSKSVHPDHPSSNLAVAQGRAACATAMSLPVAQDQVVRHVYLAVAQAVIRAPRLFGPPISIFLLVSNSGEGNHKTEKNPIVDTV